MFFCKRFVSWRMWSKLNMELKMLCNLNVSCWRNFGVFTILSIGSLLPCMFVSESKIHRGQVQYMEGKWDNKCEKTLASKFLAWSGGEKTLASWSWAWIKSYLPLPRRSRVGQPARSKKTWPILAQKFL